MKKVYLLGAGASYGKRNADNEIVEGLPIVSEILPELCRFRDFISHLEDNESTFLVFGVEQSFKYVQEQILSDLDSLIKAASEYNTIDCYSKSVYEKKGSTDNKWKFNSIYGKIKFLMTSFFFFEQCRYPYDSRYDRFLRSILTSDRNISDDIFIMTWNYDMQLELSYDNFSNDSLPICIPIENNTDNSTELHTKIFKINGSANYYGKYHLHHFISTASDEDLGMIIFEQYARTSKCYVNRYLFSSGTTDMCYAWEREHFDKKMHILMENISNAEILVVIGYSFPDINSGIDRDILMGMPRLKKIYIQDVNSECIRKRLSKLINPIAVEIKLLKLTEYPEFYVPE